MKSKCLTLLMLIVVLLVPLSVMAQRDGLSSDNKAEKREQWFKEMRAKKQDFLIKEIGLKPEQQSQFFEIYFKMENDMKAVNDRTRELERNVLMKDGPTDAECDAAIDAIYNQRYLEWSIENQAKVELSKFLTKKQLIKLKRAEFKFTRALMKQHRSNR